MTAHCKPGMFRKHLSACTYWEAPISALSQIGSLATDHPSQQHILDTVPTLPSATNITTTTFNMNLPSQSSGILFYVKWLFHIISPCLHATKTTWLLSINVFCDHLERYKSCIDCATTYLIYVYSQCKYIVINMDFLNLS